MNMFYRVVKNHHCYTRTVDVTRKFNSPTIIFLIASRNCPSVIEKTVKAIHNACVAIGYREYRVVIVTDKFTHVREAEIIVVPKTYSVNAKYKARALQYALSKLPKNKDVWLYHLDEESIVTEQCVRSLLEHIEDNGELVSEGPINYPNDIRNPITLFLESERAVSCHYCVDQMKIAPLWLHGSNLLVNSVVEHEVGWEFGGSLAEDQRFGFEVERKFGNCFGWHGGLVLEKPAFTIGDAVKQRKRWFYGSLQNLPFIPLKRSCCNCFS